MPAHRIAEVLIDLKLEKTLDYLIPSDLSLKVGSRVIVPVRGKSQAGFVVKLKEESDFSELKAIEKSVGDQEMITPQLFTLALWMAKYYATPLRQVLQAIVPASIRHNKQSKKQYFVTRLKTKEELKEACEKLRLKGSPQALVLDVILIATKGMFLSELIQKAGVTRSPIQTLVKQGMLKLELVRGDPSFLTNEEYFKTKPKQLKPEQKEALQRVVEDLDQKRFNTHLLWGITGSGKTEIYLQAIEHALKQGRGSIMLVPEIALTEQTIERFKARFEGHIACLHCRLSDGERYEEWQKIREGKTQIVIGARSSVFAPVQNLSLLIVDEEHEATYKQTDDAPRYHAREIAIMRASQEKGVVILGSATPSLESYHNAVAGKYSLSTLTLRPDKQHLPVVTLVDMKREKERSSIFSELLIAKLKEKLKNGEQSILFLNRRGYFTCQKCLHCGEAVKCRHCDVTLTFHKHEKGLFCHLCGFNTPPMGICPACKAQEPLKFKGFGTELVESSLKALLPEARVLRMDADTTRHKGSHQRLFKAFGTGKADILIGTQMIAKGLHFPQVTLVGVLSCDSSLNIPDFRASETTFQLLTQVAGRAGRGGVPGEVILQTFTPENRTLELAKNQDFKTFFEEESEMRKLFQFPPFSQLVKIQTASTDQRLAYETLEKIRTALRPHLPPDYEILPTTPAGHAKVKDQFRFHALIKGPSVFPITRAFTEIEKQLPASKNLKIAIDVNPTSTFF